MAVQPQPQPARAAATQTTPVAAPDYVVAAQKADAAVLNRIEQNPIYKHVFEGNATWEQRRSQVIAYLMAGLAEGTAQPEDMDRRRQQLAELNNAIQVIRKQLGAEQAQEITSKAYADFQLIVNDTSHDVGKFEEELAPLCDLADLLSKYGATGNLIESINAAKAQKLAREERLAIWSREHAISLLAYQQAVTDVQTQLTLTKAKLERAWVGHAGLQAKIANLETDLATRQQELTEAREQAPPEDHTAPVVDGEVTAVNEEILELQNIGGPKFKAAVIKLRDDTERALAKISTNFDAAVEGLTNARESFIKMDRNCGDATFALSVLESAVQEAEKQSRAIAQDLIEKSAVVDPATLQGKSQSELDLARMEREQRSEDILTYTSALTTFITNIGVAVTSLRSGKTVIQSILRMNAMALEQANTHKITGIANTADAVTITIGSIIEVCNRAASRALADGLTRMRRVAQAGSARLVGGTVEAIQQQNEQLQGFVQSVTDLRTMTHEISANTVGLLKQQFDIVAKMQQESGALADATTEAQRTSFAARAGIETAPKPEDPPATDQNRAFRMRMGHNA